MSERMTDAELAAIAQHDRSVVVNRLLAEVRRLTKENDILRGIAAKIMPCHYCGVDEIAKCPHGFPGCALADDLMCADEAINVEVRRLREEVDSLGDDLRFAHCAQAELDKRIGELLAQYEPEGERDQTPCCPDCGPDYGIVDLEGTESCANCQEPTVPRWRYQAAQKLLKGGK